MDCRECKQPIAEPHRNVANADGEFPYCSHACALRGYWGHDQYAAIQDTLRRLEAKETQRCSTTN